MKVTHTHMRPRTRLVLASIIVLTTLLYFGARPSIALAASCGTYSIVAVATSTNVTGDSLYIDEGDANNNPSAFLFVTQNWNPNDIGGVYNNHPIGVWYDRYKGRWAIFNEDLAAMPLGAAFNVLISVYYEAKVCYDGTVVASSANTVDNSLSLPISFELNDRSPVWHPQFLFLATPNWNPNSASGVYNNHPIGAWFKGFEGPWTISNQDGVSMPPGAAFNVAYHSICNADIVICSPIQETTSEPGTLDGNATIINDPALNGQPSAHLFVTPNIDPNGGYRPPVANNHNIGVWYNVSTARWEIFNEDHSAIPAGVSFNYTVFDLAPY